MAAPAIGIDLGTTYSCVAVHRAGKTEVIANPLGNRITPSMVAFGKERLIGDAAKDQQDRNERNTVYGVKRLIGRNWDDSGVQSDIENWPFTVVNEKGRPKVVVTHDGSERSFFPEEISSMVLGYMKTTAEKHLGKTVRNAVVTVPAYFNDSQRQATKDAATIAGLNVLRIINEPTAAALAYDLSEQHKDERNVLIFDFGGGTFDVSVLVIEEGIFEVRSTTGDTRLGGEDLDVALAAHFAEEFEVQHGFDLKSDKDAMNRLRRASERAKCILSGATETSIELSLLYEGLDFRATLTRAQFENICGDLIRRTMEPVARALQDARLNVQEIHEVVLVGGSTRIPMVQELLRELFEGRELAQTVNPDEAVAAGAAVQAVLLQGDPSQTVTDLVLLDITPLSLGISTRGGVMTRLIERNTAIPCEHTETFSTAVDNQQTVLVEVYEGERGMVAENNQLGRFTLSGIPRAPRGVPLIDVTFHINENGILEVRAVERENQRSNMIAITNERNRLSRREIERLIREAEEMKQQDEAKQEAARARHQLETYCLRVKARADERSVKDRMEPKERQKVVKMCDETLQWMDSAPGAARADFDRKLSVLHEICSPLIKEYS